MVEGDAGDAHAGCPKIEFRKESEQIEHDNDIAIVPVKSTTFNSDKVSLKLEPSACLVPRKSHLQSTDHTIGKVNLQMDI